jgi:hypothetical protein
VVGYRTEIVTFGVLEMLPLFDCDAFAMAKAYNAVVFAFHHCAYRGA